MLLIHMNKVAEGNYSQLSLEFQPESISCRKFNSFTLDLNHFLIQSDVPPSFLLNKVSI